MSLQDIEVRRNQLSDASEGFDVIFTPLQPNGTSPHKIVFSTCGTEAEAGKFAERIDELTVGCAVESDHITKALNALKVISMTPHIVIHLTKHDPQALRQVRDAIKLLES